MDCKRCGSCGEWGGYPQCGRDLEIFLEYFDPDFIFPIVCPEVGALGYEIDLLEELIETLKGSPLRLLKDPKHIGLWIFHNVAIVKLDGKTFQNYLEFREKTGAQVVFQCAEFPFECPIPGCAAIWVAEEDLALAKDHGLPVSNFTSLTARGFNRQKHSTGGRIAFAFFSREMRSATQYAKMKPTNGKKQTKKQNPYAHHFRFASGIAGESRQGSC